MLAAALALVLASCGGGGGNGSTLTVANSVSSDVAIMWVGVVGPVPSIELIYSFDLSLDPITPGEDRVFDVDSLPEGDYSFVAEFSGPSIDDSYAFRLPGHPSLTVAGHS